MADWRVEKRIGIDRLAAESSPGEITTHVSPAERYELAIAQWHSEKGWSYCEGVARRPGGDPLAMVRRNYGSFPFLFCEDHPNGHDYLICGEDYQGQTIIELDTGTRVDHLPDAAREGHAFCWVTHFVSPDRNYLVVDGCYWACPYEIVVYDFTDPLEAPRRELHRFADPVRESFGFDDDVFVWKTDQDIRVADGKPAEDLSEDEFRAMLNENGRMPEGAFTTRIFNNEWRAGTPFDSATRTVIDG